MSRESEQSVWSNSLSPLGWHVLSVNYKETSQTNTFTLPFHIKTGMCVGLDMHIPLVVVHSVQQGV